jgi:serine/threonine protein kinase
VNPERWQQLKQLFEQALKHPPDERSQFLAQACGDDDALRREAEALLSSHNEAEDFMEQGAVGELADVIVGAKKTLTPGQRIEHYEIIQKLGEGGMGEVYLAQDTKLNRNIAIKFLALSTVADEQAKERFLREAQSAATLDHPHVCGIYEIGEANGQPFIVMQYVEGETLAELLKQTTLTLDRAIDIAIQIADALAEAHAHGIAHRDIKPSNVIITRRGDVKVLDFGLAKKVRVESEDETQKYLSQPGMIIGTLGYMSPEQARGKDVDARTDIFSFGVVLYEMIAGRTPFESESKSDTLSAILNKEPLPLARYAVDVPGELQRIVGKTLRKDRDERYQTIKDVLADLKDLRDELQGQARSERSFANAEANQPTLVLDAKSTQEEKAESSVEVVAQTTASTGAITSPPNSRKLVVLVALGFGLAALLAAGFWFIRTRRNSFAAIDVQALTQVTDWPGLDDFPAISPDGKAVAYDSDHNGTFEIYVKALTPGAKESQLTNDSKQNFQPTWSPDGQHIAYHSKLRGGIWMIPAAGGDAKQLTEFGTHPAWSPDGKQIAFQSYPLNDLGAGGGIALPPSTLWLVSPQGGEPKQLTQVGTPPGGHGAPSWSPDGKRIVFDVDDYNSSSFWSISINGDNPRIVWKLGDEPVYAPDGKSIIFSGLGAQQIRINPDTGDPIGEPTAISGKVSFPRNIRRVSFSADGKKMVFNTLMRSESLASIPVSPGSSEAAGAPVTLVRKSSGRINQPAFSPDGKRIAFTSCLTGVTRCDTWLVNADGTNQIQLTTAEGSEQMPSWFPDMQQIAFITDRTGHWTYWAIDLNTKRERVLIDLKDDLMYARLSPDGKWVVYNSKLNGGVINVWTVPVTGGESKQLTFEKELTGFACWSYDNKYIAIQTLRGDNSNVLIMPSQGGEPTQLTFDKGLSWQNDFSPDSDKVLFAGSRNGLWNLWWVSRSTKKEQQLTNYTTLNSFVRYPIWSPLGNQIAYEYSETTGNVWVADLK